MNLKSELRQAQNNVLKFSAIKLDYTRSFDEWQDIDFYLQTILKNFAATGRSLNNTIRLDNNSLLILPTTYRTKLWCLGEYSPEIDEKDIKFFCNFHDLSLKYVISSGTSDEHVSFEPVEGKIKAYLITF